MKRIFLAGAIALSSGFSGMAFAQEAQITVALLDQSAWQPVIARCQSVAANQIKGEPGPDLLCVNSTVNYLTDLRTGVIQNIFSDDSRLDSMAEFLANLAGLALEDANCSLRDTEIPEALQQAQKFYDDPTQKQALVDIVGSILSCNPAATAAGPEPRLVSPA